MPTLLWAQEPGSYYLGYNYGVIEDVYYPDLDINPYYPDMASDFEGILEHRNASQYSLGYQVNKKLVFGVNYKDAEIYGSNEIEYYEGVFTEFNVFTHYDVFAFKKVTVYATGSVGQVDFSANRSLMFDDGIIPLNTFSGDSEKFSYGLGLRIPFGDNVHLTLDYSFDEVMHDGFDGWDCGSGVDRYTFKSFGLRYNL